MRILVTVKYVPDLQSTRTFGADGRVTRSADDGSMNELDEYAVEAALQLVEKHGGEVTALTLGGDDAELAVRKALQLGANHAVHVNDPAAAGSDVFGTAAILAAAVKKLHAEEPIDLVITGMATMDGLTSMLPTALATMLEWPQLTLASKLDVEDGVATVMRHLPDAHETVSAPLPALVSVTDELCTPRFPNFKMIMASRSIPVTKLTLADLGVPETTVGSAGARTTVMSAVERPARENTEIVTDTGDGEAAKKLAEFLVGKGFA